MEEESNKETEKREIENVLELLSVSKSSSKYNKRERERERKSKQKKLREICEEDFSNVCRTLSGFCDNISMTTFNVSLFWRFLFLKLFHFFSLYFFASFLFPPRHFAHFIYSTQFASLSLSLPLPP